MRGGLATGRACIAGLALLAAGAAWPAQRAPLPPAPPVVEVRAAPGSVATGFEVRPGRIVTVAHAVEGRRSVAVSGRRAMVLRIDRRNDLALLATTPARTPSAAGATGVLVRRAGRARLLPAHVRRRIVAHMPPYSRPALELAAHVTAGDSGAPVLGSDGRLLGVIFAASRTRPGTAYAVDARAVGRLLQSVRAPSARASEP